MTDETAKPAPAASPITAEQMAKFRELQKKINEFQKSLKPRKEAIFDAVMGNVDIDEVKQLIEFSGKESLTVSGDYENQKITVSFRLGKSDEED